MTIKFQIAAILRQTNLSQEKLAQILDVSFVTLNSWVNGRSQPRPSAKGKINELYLKVTGQLSLPRVVLEKKFKILQQKQAAHPNVLQNILKRPDLADEFMLSLTYHSNRIEGNTLTQDETASVLFNKNPLPDKTFLEQLEVKNHQAALLYLWRNIKDPLTEKWILRMHGILMNGIREDAGTYRNHAVRIVGTHVPTANFLKIPQLMKDLIRKIRASRVKNFSDLALIHAQFEKIHPFSDGNGRIGRLLLHAMLLKRDFAPAIIREENRRLYYRYLQKAQLENDSSLLEDFFMDAVLEGYEFLE